MVNSSRAIRALIAAAAGASLLGIPHRMVRADVFWIDPSDPGGAGGDPNAGANLSANYTSVANWSNGLPPGTSDNIHFNVGGYPAIAYTVSFTQNQSAARVLVGNAVTLNLNGFSYNLFQSAVPSLVINDNASLLLQNGVVHARTVQIGSASGIPAATTALGLDNATLTIVAGSTIFNYQNINIMNGGALQLGMGVLLNQAPDLAAGGVNASTISIDGSSQLVLNGGDTLRGGSLRVADGGGVSALGTTLTYDSLYYDSNLTLTNPLLAMNLASTLTDPHHGNAVIPTTITGSVNLAAGTLTINSSTVQLTPDSGNTWTPFSTTGGSSLVISNALLTVGQLTFDGDPESDSGSLATLSASLIAIHGDMIVGELANASVSAFTSPVTFNVDGSLVIGDQSGSSGSLLLFGAPAAVTTGMKTGNSVFGNGDLIVGNQGTGNFTLLGGARATVGGGFNAFVGADGGGAGTLTISGYGSDTSGNYIPSTLDLLSLGNGDLFVGLHAGSIGTLNVTFGARMLDVNGHVGAEAGASGSVLLDGQSDSFADGTFLSSQWTNTRELLVGDAGSGSLTVTNGAIAAAGTSLLIGNQAGSNGSVHLSSQGSLQVDTTHSATDKLAIGVSGTGALTLDTGAIVTAFNTAVIAANAGSSGAVSIDAAQLNITNEFDVALAGAGALSIVDGGQVTNTLGYIAFSPGSAATVLVDHATWTNSSLLEVADRGSASLTLQNSAHVSATNIHFSFFPGSSSQTIVDHALLSASGALTLAGGGSATLTLQNGASLSDVNATIAFAVTGSGTATVDGLNSHWASSGMLQVGLGGTAALNITNGGLVSNTTGIVGANAKSTGTVTVDGSGSSWASSGGLIVGNSGSGTLLIQNAGLVSNALTAFIGANASANGHVTVTGLGSAWNSSAQIVVGADGTADLTIANGGIVSAAAGGSPSGSALSIGQEGNAIGLVTVTDPGSSLTLSGHLSVGLGDNGTTTAAGGSGTLLILDGGNVSDANGYVGRYSGSTGAATVSGTGSLWQNNGTFFLAANDSANNFGSHTLAAGSGTATVGSGGTISANASAVIGAAGLLHMQGGTFIAPAIALDGLILGNGDIFGTITGSGTIQSESPGILTTDSFQVASLIVNGTHVLRPSPDGASKTNSLIVAGGPGAYSGKLDITNNALIVQTNSANYSATLSSLRSLITAGYDGGDWAGNGITSSTVASNASYVTTLAIASAADLQLSSFRGQSVDNGSLIVVMAHLGDTNLDGNVDIQDLNAVVAHWQQSGMLWSGGDMTSITGMPDGKVDIQDLNAVVANWQWCVGTDSSPGSSPFTPSFPVPEPATLALLALAAPTLLLRRKPRRPV